MSDLLPLLGMQPLRPPAFGARTGAPAAEGNVPAGQFAALLAQLIPGRMPIGVLPIPRIQHAGETDAPESAASESQAAIGEGEESGRLAAGQRLVAYQDNDTVGTGGIETGAMLSSTEVETLETGRVDLRRAGAPVTVLTHAEAVGADSVEGVASIADDRVREADRGRLRASDADRAAASAALVSPDGGAPPVVGAGTAHGVQPGPHSVLMPQSPIAAGAPDSGESPPSADGSPGLGSAHRQSGESSSQGPAANRLPVLPDRAGLSSAAVIGEPHGLAGAGWVDPTQVESSQELLHPEFRVRLERVVTRMSVEHGHDVQVVETLRHQARQNYLFEQGRSRPGDVVTWTRSSNHTAGVAADVIIDGSYTHSAAYARLEQIAAQEGLRTLGVRDPGHIELARDGGEPIRIAGNDVALDEGAEPAPLRAAANASTDARGRLARPSAVARVANPASVGAARVAEIATPATPGASPASRSRTATATSRSVPFEVAHTKVRSTAAPVAGIAAEPAQPANSPATAESAHTPVPEAPSPALSSGAAARIAHLLDLQSAAPLKPLSQILLRVDGPDGEDRIRLDFRGNSVAGTIDLSDSAVAQRLDSRIAELQRALEQHGLEAQGVRVRVTPQADAVELTRVAMTAVDSEPARAAAPRSNGDSSPQRDRPSEHPRDDARQGSSDPRQRSRKEQRGGDPT